MIRSLKELERKRRRLEEERPAPKERVTSNPGWVLPLVGSVLSGLLLALAFPGWGKATVMFAALVPLMFAVQSVSFRRAAWLGLLSGFIFSLTALSWLFNLTGMVEGGMLKFSAVLGYAVLALYCALYFIPFSLTVHYCMKKWGHAGTWWNLRMMFLFTLVWVAMEYLRGILFTGFPWLALGVSQYQNITIIQVAEWGGVSIISAFIVWMNAAIFFTIRQYTHGDGRLKYRPHFELMAGILPIILSLMYGMNLLMKQPKGLQPVSVALIQPNISQRDKWDEAKERTIRRTLETLTSSVARSEDVDLIIWPETALPDYVRVSPESMDLVRRITASGTPLLTGSMDVARTGSEYTFYNSSILFGADGVELGKYDKQHLVPFGEYVPFPALMKKFTPIEEDCTAGRESTLMRVERAPPFSVLICFEDIVAPLAARAVRQGARWLVNQTNDAWFDSIAQSEQHLAHAVFRCIENRVPMARCGNSGVSCTIDTFGRVAQSLKPNTAGFSIAVVQTGLAGTSTTTYTRKGDLFAKGSLIACAAIMVSLRLKVRIRKRKAGR